MSKYVYRAFLFLCLIVIGFSFPSQAGVAITQKHILIEGRTRFADAVLINTSNEPTTYEMTWRFFRMSAETGRYETVPGSLTEFDISKHIVYTPKRITVPAKSSQKVRLALRLNGATPEPGDYRAHLEFHEAGNAKAAAPTDKDAASIGIKINVGFSIPVIYRSGVSDVTASIGNVTTQLNKAGKIEAVIPITRKGGPFGILGNLKVFYTAAGGAEQFAGEITNANIFPEISSKTMTVGINAASLAKGSLRIIYQDQADVGTTVYDQKIIPIR